MSQDDVVTRGIPSKGKWDMGGWGGEVEAPNWCHTYLYSLYIYKFFLPIIYYDIESGLVAE